MIYSCDLTSAMEDGGIGGIIVAVLVAVWQVWLHHQKAKQETHGST